MPEKHWIKAAGESDLKEGKPIVVTIDDKEVLLVRSGEQIHACGNKCTHYGGRLSEGWLSNHAVTCPRHNSRFNVKTGRMIAPPALDDLPVYPVKVENGQVFVGKAEFSNIPVPSLQDKRTFLIVGAGAAGNAAAETLRREGFSGRILMLTAEPDRPYDRPNLSKDFMAGSALPEWIPLRGENYYKDYRLELLTGHRVTAVDTAARNVTLFNGKQIHFDRCLLATGGVPHRLNGPGSELENVFTLRSLADARAIISAVEQAKVTVVAGAGFIGTEVASSLRQRGLEVHLVAPEKLPLVNLFGERVGERIRRIHEEQGIRLHLGMTIKEITGPGRVGEVILSDGSHLSADMVVSGLGILPAVAFLENTGLIRNGAVPVNGRLETGAEGIYAAGDIAIVPDPVTGEGRRIEHWAVAERQGQHAARAMLGQTDPYNEVPFFWTEQHGELLKYVGFARNFDQVACRGDVEKGDFLAGYYSGGQLKAAASTGLGKDLFAIEAILKTGRSFSFDQFRDENVDLFSRIQ